MADDPSKVGRGSTKSGAEAPDHVNLIDVPPEVAVHDRIMDAYYGKMGDDFMRKTQERVHWVCAQAMGSRVLDVGCSQGIVPILLGREGRRVTGIDVDAQAIETAKAHLAAGPGHVAANVEFILDDFMNHDFSGQRFDAVVMSEVLEHLVDPAPFVERAAELLAPAGRFVVTVPFGINDFIDHKRTYYLVEPYRLLSRWFEIDTLQLFGRWIGFAGVRRKTPLAAGDAAPVACEQFRAAESAFNAIERSLATELKRVKEQLSAANQKYRESTQTVTQLRKQVADGAGELASNTGALGKAKAELDHSLAELSGARELVHGKQFELVRLESQVSHLEKLLDASRATEAEWKSKARELHERQGRDAMQGIETLHARQLELVRAEEQLRHAQGLLDSSRASEESLRQVAGTLRDQVAEHERASSARASELQHKQLELTRAEEQLHQVQGLLDSSRASEELLRQLVDTLRAQIGEHEQSLADHADKIRHLVAEKQRADESEESLRQAIEKKRHLQDRLIAQASEAERLQQDLLGHAKAHEEARVQILGLNQRVSASEAAVESSRQQLAEAQRLLSVERKRAMELDASLKDSQATTRRAEKSRDKAASATAQYQRWLMESRAGVYFIQHTVAFQLGSILTFAFRSPKNFLKTPWRLARLVRAAWHRGPDGRPGHVFIPDLPMMPVAVSPAPAVPAVSRPVVPQPTGMKVRSHASQHRVSVKVDPGNEVVATAAIRYPDGVASREKHAVALLHAFDGAGKTVEASVPGFSHSERLKGTYRYLGCTGGVSKPVLRFRVPQGVARIEIEVRPFNLPLGLRLDIGELVVEARAAATSPVVAGGELSILDWPECEANGKPAVMAVMDEFTTGCFENDLALVLPRPDNWRALAEKYKPEMFFIESAWKGNGGSWQYRVAEYANRPGEEITDMALYASERGIPLVFWNKEDPVHHQKFMVTAKLADHVFTTDANMCNSYREKTGNPSAHALPFAAQPALHFPAVLEGRHQQSCFAGSWYGDRHEARGESMRWLLRAGNRHGMVIYDRNHGSGNFTFPEEYHPAIRGGLPYKELCAEYRRYRVFLNVNSVTDSPTMFSRRVFELMACGTPVVSTFARGIEELFESKAVWLVDSEEQADEAIRTLLSDDAEWRRRSLAGIRDVFANHTYAHRLNQVFGQAGLATRLPVDPKVLLLALAADDGEIERLIDIARAQRYPALALRVGARVSETRRVQLGTTEVEIVPAARLTSAGFDVGAKAIGWISARASYGPGYVRDLANAMTYRPEAQGWGKALERDAFAFGQSGQLQASIWLPGQLTRDLSPGALARHLSNEHFFIADQAEYAPEGMQVQILEK
jgi:SAM-dependent methyltransferase